MKIFLSYPSAERPTAERLALALEAEGHDVFFDRHDLPAGDGFHQKIRESIFAAELFVFFVTPASVAAGSYALAELAIAQEHWRRPGGHVLPVMLAETPIATMPPYLTAVTLLQPRGEMVAETVAAVARLAASGGGHAVPWRRIAVVGVVVAMAAGGGLLWRQHQQQQAAAQAGQQAAAEAARAGQAAAQLCSDGSFEPAMQRFAELLAQSPLPPGLSRQQEDCAMRWLREMRATSGDGKRVSFDEQVAQAQPVLLRGLGTATGQRAADLRAHFGWGERLRRKEGSGLTDPLPHWQRALTEEPGNVYALSMWANSLPGSALVEAPRLFAQALASGRERAWVRQLQFGWALGGSEAQTAYAAAVADEMRRAGEPLPAALTLRLWNYVFGTRLLDPAARTALFAAVPAADLLATFDALFPPAETTAQDNPIGRFGRALLQARAGQRDAARSALQALQRELKSQGQSGRLLDQTEAALKGLGPSG